MYILLLFIGTLHVGDEIREINGVNVSNQTVENLQRLLVSHFCKPWHEYKYTQEISDITQIKYVKNKGTFYW